MHMFSRSQCRHWVWLFALAVGCDVGAVAPAGDPVLAGADGRPLAADVAISNVAAYQAVRIPLMENDRAVADGDRDAHIVVGRDLAVRVDVRRAAPDERRLAVRLDLARPGQAAAAYTEEAVSFPAGSNQADVVLLVAGADVMAGARYALSVVDSDAQAPAGDTSRARWPRDPGSYEALEPKSSSGVSIVIVPIGYNGVDAPAVPADAMADLAQALYPVAEGGVTVTVAPAASLTVSLAADPTSPYAGLFPDGHPFWMSDEVFAELHDRRSAAGSGAYYYGYIDHAELFGMAEAIPSVVAYGTTNDGIVTFVHELGHDLGLRHAPCGGAGGPDPAYPYAGASIGVEGYDPRSRSFLDPARYYDFMSYCAPEWVSDYHFDKLHRVLSPTFKLPVGSIRADPVPCDFVR